MKRSSPPRGLFIIGTDTGVGKTLIAGALARSLVLRGIDCGVMKPIESGCRLRKGHLIPADGTYLRAAARSKDPLEVITPFRFRTPLAPYAAALKEGRKPVDLKKIVAAVKGMQKAHDFLIVEGLGGLMVPLNAKDTLIDLIRELNFPVLLVAQSGLGTLNHCLLTLNYGKSQGLHFSGLLLNRITPKKPASEASNLRLLNERTTLPVLGPLPYLPKKGTREALIAQSAGILDRKTAIIKAIIEAFDLVR